MDVLNRIYQALIADDYIQEKVKDRIKGYEYPATGDVTGPFIVIDPLDAPLPSDYADDNWLTDDYLFQIEVWSKNRLITQELASRIRHVMWDLGFRQNSGINEFDEGIYRDARRYRGKLYRDDLDSL